jgi:hypothetical protein
MADMAGPWFVVPPSGGFRRSPLQFGTGNSFYY